MSRILKNGTVTAARKWQAPAMSATSANESQDQRSAPTLEDVHEAARLEGFRQGLDEARRQAGEQATQIDAVLARLAAPFEGYEEQLEQELLALVKALTRQLVRREMHSDPSQVMGVIREAIRTLPSAATEIRIRLHPEDAALVRGLVKSEQRTRPWEIREDPGMERGGCIVSNANTSVDATLESRLGRLIAEMLGSERADDD